MQIRCKNARISSRIEIVSYKSKNMYISSSLIASQFRKRKTRNVLQPYAKTLIPIINPRLEKFHSRRTRSCLHPTVFDPTWNYSKPSRLNSSVLESAPLEIWKSFGERFESNGQRFGPTCQIYPDSISDKIVYPAILSYSKST